MARVHHLKTHPGPFEDLRLERKRFELRRLDRDFQVGDQIVHLRHDPDAPDQTGAWFLTQITYILRPGMFPGLAEGFGILSVTREVDVDPALWLGLRAMTMPAETVSPLDDAPDPSPAPGCAKCRRYGEILHLLRNRFNAARLRLKVAQVAASAKGRGDDYSN